MQVHTSASIETLAPTHSKIDQSALAQLDNASLIAHILKRYHEVHREQLAELIALAQRVENVHGDHKLAPTGLTQQLTKMQGELEQHMQKEEQILFPMLLQEFAPMVGGPIHVMETEHDEHKAEIAALLALTNNLTLPEDACNTWTTLYENLFNFIEDLYAHIYIENEILFSRAKN